MQRKLNTTHGKKDTRLYKIWCGIKRRCYNANEKSYKNYGGRGITICDEWLNDFMNFYNWALSNGYTEKLSIDRINSNGNYEPNNCKWSNEKEQANNRRSNKLFTYKGETKNLTQWCECLDISYKMVTTRLYKGWNFKTAIETPPLRKKGKNERIV